MERPVERVHTGYTGQAPERAAPQLRCHLPRAAIPITRLAYSLLRDKGRLRWLEVTASLHRDPDGSIQRMVGTVKDITERRNSEQALMRSEAKFSALFQSSPDPYLLVNATTQLVIEINQSFSRVFGYSTQDIIGRTALEVGLWRNEHERAEVVRKIDREKGLESIEIDFLTARVAA